jgi:hypothetical protein
MAFNSSILRRIPKSTCRSRGSAGAKIDPDRLRVATEELVQQCFNYRGLPKDGRFVAGQLN